LMFAMCVAECHMYMPFCFSTLARLREQRDRHCRWHRCVPTSGALSQRSQSSRVWERHDSVCASESQLLVWERHDSVCASESQLLVGMWCNFTNLSRDGESRFCRYHFALCSAPDHLDTARRGQHKLHTDQRPRAWHSVVGHWSAENLVRQGREHLRLLREMTIQ
jgi:hypothetical protein